MKRNKKHSGPRSVNFSVADVDGIRRKQPCGCCSRHLLLTLLLLVVTVLVLGSVGYVASSSWAVMQSRRRVAANEMRGRWKAPKQNTLFYTSGRRPWREVDDAWSWAPAACAPNAETSGVFENAPECRLKAGQGESNNTCDATCGFYATGRWKPSASSERAKTLARAYYIAVHNKTSIDLTARGRCTLAVMLDALNEQHGTTWSVDPHTGAPTLHITGGADGPCWSELRPADFVEALSAAFHVKEYPGVVDGTSPRHPVLHLAGDAAVRSMVFAFIALMRGQTPVLGWRLEGSLRYTVTTTVDLVVISPDPQAPPASPTSDQQIAFELVYQYSSVTERMPGTAVPYNAHWFTDSHPWTLLAGLSIRSVDSGVVVTQPGGANVSGTLYETMLEHDDTAFNDYLDTLAADWRSALNNDMVRWVYLPASRAAPHDGRTARIRQQLVDAFPQWPARQSAAVLDSHAVVRSLGDEQMMLWGGKNGESFMCELIPLFPALVQGIHREGDRSCAARAPLAHLHVILATLYDHVAQVPRSTIAALSRK